MTKPKNDFKAVCDAKEGRTKTFAEIDAELRSDPQCVYHEGDDDADERF